VHGKQQDIYCSRKKEEEEEEQEEEEVGILGIALIIHFSVFFFFFFAISCFRLFLLVEIFHQNLELLCCGEES